jgi:signal transduction histidine kinase
LATEKIHTLEATLSSASGIEKISAMADLAHELRNFDAKRAIALADEAIADIQAMQDLPQTAFAPHPKAEGIALSLRFYDAQCRCVRGVCNRILSHYKQAIEDSVAAHKTYEEIEIQAKGSLALAARKGTADALGNLGKIYWGEGDFVKALDFQMKALSLYENIEDVAGQAATYNDLGGIYYNLGDFAQALEVVMKGRGLYEQIHDLHGQATALNNIAAIYNELGDKDACKTISLKSIEIKEAIGDQRGKAYTLIGLGSLYLESNESQQAIDSFMTGLHLAEETGDVSVQAIALDNLGNAHLSMGNLDEGLEFHGKALGLRQAIGDKRGEATSYFQMGRSYLLLGHLETTIESLKQALSLATTVKAKALIYQIHRCLSEAYEKSSNIALAFEHFKLYHAAEKEVFNEASDSKAKNLQILFAVDQAKQDAEMEHLKNLDLATALIEAEYQREIAEIQRLKAEKISYSLTDVIAEVELQKNKAEVQQRLAEEANAFKTQLLGIAAHDLRNPLSAITGFAELLRNNDLPSTSVKQFGEFIFGSSQKMLSLISELLETVALDSGQIQFNPSPVNIGILTRYVVEDNRLQAEKKSLLLVFSADDDTVCTCDMERMRAVVDNLISNAIKYSPADKKIWVSVTKQPAANPSSPTTSVVRIDIRDEGQGILPEEMSKLFGRFQRLSAQPTGGESSTGLGLSIAKQFVELHGGKIRATSEGKDKGSTFTIELPCP